MNDQPNPRAVYVPAHPKNYKKGRGGNKIEGWIIHASQTKNLQQISNHFANPDSGVSTNYGVGPDGSIEQYVLDSDMAFHSGNWHINQTRLSVEFVDMMDGQEPTDAAYAAVAQLVAESSNTYGFAIGNQTVEPHNKYRATLCPGDVRVDRVIDLASKYAAVLAGPINALSKLVINIDDFKPIVYEGDLVYRIADGRMDVRLRRESDKI